MKPINKLAAKYGMKIKAATFIKSLRIKIKMIRNNFYIIIIRIYVKKY